MATVSDLLKLKSEMEYAKNNPNLCTHLGAVKITYSEVQSLWCAEFDCDLDVYFDDVDYASNNIILKRKGVPFASFCHMHQRIDSKEE